MGNLSSNDLAKKLIPLDTALDCLGEAALLLDNKGHIVHGNPTAAFIFGYPISKLTSLSLATLRPDFSPAWWKDYWKSNFPFTQEAIYLTKGGHLLRLEIVANKFTIEAEEYSLQLIREVTETKIESELQLGQREAYLRTLLDNFPFMVWLKDTDSHLLAANTAYAKMAGVPSVHDLEGKTDFDFFPEELAEQYVQGDREAMQSAEPIGIICPIRDAHGEYFWIESYKSRLVVEEKIVGTVGYARDITETLKKEREYRSLVENSPNQIVRFDRNCRRIFMNTRTSDAYGVPPERLLGKSPREFPGGLSGMAFEKMIRKVLFTGINQSFDLNIETPDGQPKVFHIMLAGEVDDSGAVMSVIGVGQDVTETVENQARIHHLAYFDSLTNLPNRALLSDRLSQSRAKALRRGDIFGLMMLDLDRFKEINDTLGHHVGDELLKEVALRLTQCVRGEDTVARLGGDEFAILLVELRDSLDITIVASKVLKAFQLPFLISGVEFFITPSIGIAVYPNDSRDIDDLLKFADSAMYHAKKLGRNNFQLYSPALTEQATARRNVETSLRRALQNDEFELYYQPQLNLLTGEVVGVEALLRWNFEKKILSPDKFIEIAEASGLIVGVGEWVIHKACEIATLWNSGKAKPFTFAINLSTRQFIRNDLVTTLKNALINSGCRPEWLKLEITESLLLEDNDDIRHMLQQFHKMGLGISIDDFGTGYSALSYLNHFPVSQIKIDKSFIHDIIEDPDRALLVQAIVSLGLSLGKGIVAEGVESTEQAAFLQEIGCPHAQGYLFGKPMPYDQLKLVYG